MEPFAGEGRARAMESQMFHMRVKHLGGPLGVKEEEEEVVEEEEETQEAQEAREQKRCSVKKESSQGEAPSPSFGTPHGISWEVDWFCL